MRAMLLTITLAAVALAGCSEEPPSGEFSSSGSAITVDGHVMNAMYQPYVSGFADSPAGPLSAAVGECPVDQAPPELDQVLGAYKCTMAASAIDFMFVSLPMAGSGSWSMGLIDPTIGADPASASALTDNGDGTYAWNFTSDDENVEETYDSLGLYVTVGSTATLVATSALPENSQLAVAEGLMGISYSASYEGKDLVLTVRGIDESNPVSVEGWLVKVDENGAKTHELKVPIAGNGEQEVFTADDDVDAFQEFHIHLAGTSINLATGTIA